MSRNNLNTVAIENFLQSAKVAGKTQQKALSLTQKEYKDLADSIAMVMTRLVELQDIELTKPKQEEAITIEMDGGKL
mgnify:CR=1 FL=1